ncbi:CerR family C-terminal domain-containing protein [Pseudomonas bharatica]|uniref:CerR family C-terminal domain-containing protein n=1 Tax=Pseudomonas bharatica TaxID=2692112 RepID=UPI003B281385
MARHKPTAEGGYQRGEETRARLINSAMKLFADKGYSGASTRDIALEAGANAPALQYYFGNKEGVYRACVEHIVDRVREQLDDQLLIAERVLADSHSSDEALIEAYLGLLSGFITLIHDSSEATAWRQFMGREQSELGTPDTREIMNQRLHAPIRSVTACIMGRLTGLPADDERTQIRTFALNSQGLVFRVLRQQVMSALGWEHIDKPRMQAVREVLLEQTRLTLQALVAARDFKSESIER